MTLPDRIVFRHSRRRLALYAALAGAFALGFLASAIARWGDWTAWLSVPGLVLFGALAAAPAIALARSDLGLILNSNGFELRLLFARRQLAWREATAFRLETVAEGFGLRSRRVRCERIADGSTIGIGGPWEGIGAEELCALANAFRTRALERAEAIAAGEDRTA